MARRNEYDLVDVSMEELLETAFRKQEAFATTNYALYWAINNGNWEGADKIFEKLPKSSIKKILPWWVSLFNNGDLEGMLLIVWLERHGKVEADLLNTPHKYYQLLRSKYDIPSWIIEKKK